MLKNCLCLLWLAFAASAFGQEFRGSEFRFIRTGSATYDIFADIYYQGSGPAIKPYLRVKCSLIPVDTALLLTVDSLPFNFHRARYQASVLLLTVPPQIVVRVLDTFYLPPLVNVSGNNAACFFLETFLRPGDFQFEPENVPPFFVNHPGDYYFDDGALIFNSWAVDPNGDSFYYTLIDYGGDALYDYDYSLPAASDLFFYHASSGVLTWDKPLEAGKYLLGLAAREFFSERQGQRDMIIEVRPEDLQPSATGAPDTDIRFTIAPNPAQGQLRIDGAWPADAGREARLIVRDVVGKTLYDQELAGSQGRFSATLMLDGWAPGLYYLSVDVAGRIRTEKVIVY